MTDYLKQNLSPARWKSYEELSKKDVYGRSAQGLYAKNLLYSKELYVVLSGLEIAVRNIFQTRIADYKGKQDWFDIHTLQNKHQKQINDAVKHVTKITKNSYTNDDIISQLSFGFWANLCNRPYEKTLWNKALYKCFPYLGQRPNRSDIEKRLKSALILRNKIAHFEPIIKKEETLIQDYRNVLQLLYAIDPKTQEWFANLSNFEIIWNERSKEIINDNK